MGGENLEKIGNNKIAFDSLPIKWLIRIHTSEREQVDGLPLYKVLIGLASKVGLSNATALRGIMSYDSETGFHTVSPIRLALDLPLVVEILEKEEQARKYLRILNTKKWAKKGTITVEKVHVI